MVIKSVRINAEMRRNRVLDLYVSGKTQRQIAEMEDVSQTQVYKDIKKALAEYVDKDTSDVARQVQMERYSALLQLYWNQAMEGDHTSYKRVMEILHQVNQINGLYQSVNVYDQRRQSLTVNNNPITFRITDNDNSPGVPETSAISKTKAGNIFPG
jgi:hypothetical protein|tara:strand:- start:1075 stop:1542 length:468 start_codon:yes stop_codon:yes gene_type:complete